MNLDFIKNNQDKIFMAIGFMLVLSAGFFAGYFYSKEQIDGRNIIIQNPDQDCQNLLNLKNANNLNSSSNSYSDSNSDSDAVSSSQAKGEQEKLENTVLQNKTGMFVASKNSKIYHRLDCKYVNSIKKENKIWFQSAKEADDKGYAAHNCGK
jgi:hypothetical protein